MKSIIEWKTGNPTEAGDYLTIRESCIDGSRTVQYNIWLTDECSIYGPLPKSQPQGWQVASPDACDIIAWFKLNDISIEDHERNN